ncbi:MAG: MerR family transcriptional regulator [Wolbachia endosymbiont of Tyrophagus putrescentiae]|nr:MerR family transcriptional regulator [Wolbachia endosymbiont of Tyrophagus putrescentiae]
MSKKKLFYSIGEVARELDLEQHVLRFWESQFSQIKPAKCKGRRLYDQNCIETVKRIKHMLYDKGYTIKGAQKEFIEINNNAEYSENLLQEMINLRTYLVNKIESM